jgi:serine/threonine protein kinase
MFFTICYGVGHAHSEGVIHRDLKPANIFLRSDLRTPVVGDLGLCLLADQEERLTEVNEPIGARWYMAPELEDGIHLEVDAEADVYSLGKVLYWLFSGGKIFSRERHRVAQYNLTLDRKDAGIFFIYDLLDGMIVADALQRRFKDANEVAEVVETAIRRIQVNAHHRMCIPLRSRVRDAPRGTLRRMAQPPTLSNHNLNFRTHLKRLHRKTICQRAMRCTRR